MIPHDVNQDTVLSPLDALLVINDLNLNGARLLPESPSEGEEPPPFPDVNGDGYLTPADALAVINALNAICCTGEGSGEGEATGPAQRDQSGSSPEGEADPVWMSLHTDLWNPSTRRHAGALQQIDHEPVVIVTEDQAAMPPELAAYQQVTSVYGPDALPQLTERESVIDLRLDPNGFDSSLEAIFYELGNDPGCSL